MFDLCVCLPSLNEEKTIGRVLKIVDSGLSKYFPDKKTLILNVDSRSSDSTVRVFNSVPTRFEKISLISGDKLQGKGANIFNFLNYALDHDTKFLATIDSDLQSITPDWIFKLVDPLVHNSYHFVTPIYTRNPYEGSTTNHFCVPFINYFFHVSVKQPIAGEFAMSSSCARFIFSQSRPPEVYGYGIDIFLTAHALGGNFPIYQSSLGRKIHNPSFDKMVPMFEQVSATAYSLASIYSHLTTRPFCSIPDLSSVFDTVATKPDAHLINERKAYAISLLNNAIIEFDSRFPFFDKDFFTSLKKDDYLITRSSWEQILRRMFQFAASINDQNRQLVKRLTQLTLPLFLFRVLTFYEELERTTENDINNLITYDLA